MNDEKLAIEDVGAALELASSVIRGRVFSMKDMGLEYWDQIEQFNTLLQAYDNLLYVKVLIEEGKM